MLFVMAPELQQTNHDPQNRGGIAVLEKKGYQRLVVEERIGDSDL